MSNDEVWHQIKKRGNAEEAAKTLIDKALARGSKDDISCVVVSFLSFNPSIKEDLSYVSISESQFQ